MSTRPPVTFGLNGKSYKATGIVGIVQRGKDVEVRYGDGANPLVIKNTSALKVGAAVTEAMKSRR